MPGVARIRTCPDDPVITAESAVSNHPGEGPGLSVDGACQKNGIAHGRDVGPDMTRTIPGQDIYRLYMLIIIIIINIASILYIFG
jgi:hypothetical protein